MDTWPQPIRPIRHGTDSTTIYRRHITIAVGHVTTPDGQLWWVGPLGEICAAWPNREAAMDAYRHPWTWTAAWRRAPAGQRTAPGV